MRPFTGADVRPKSAMETFTLLLAPLAPHAAEELWRVLGHDRTLAWIRSVLASLPADARCIVVEDASPETSLVDALQALAERCRIVLRTAVFRPRPMPVFEPPARGT